MTQLDLLKEQFEDSLHQLVLAHTPESLPGLREMVSYHFGWSDLSPSPENVCVQCFYSPAVKCLAGSQWI